MIQPSENKDLILRYYPDTPVTCYAYSRHVRDLSHLTPDVRQEIERSNGATTWLTGNMEWNRYMRLKRSIQEDGILNPFIVEYYKKDKGNGKYYDRPVLAIRTGNNRACILSELGIERGPVLFAVPRSVERLLPDDPYTDIPINSSLLSTLRSLWGEVLRAPEDEHDGNLGVPDAWMDSNLLLATVRSTMENPNSLTRQRSERDEA